MLVVVDSGKKGTDHCKRGGLSSGGGIRESDRDGTSLTRACTMRDWV
jgi:hypothetical protein